MLTPTDMVQRLNLLRSAPTFILQEEGDTGEAIVRSARTIPMVDTVVWVAGISTLADGGSLESVFRVVPESGDIPISVYWHINDAWYESDDPDAVERLGRDRTQVFPFSWRYSVPFPD